MTAPHTGHWTDEPCLETTQAPTHRGYARKVLNGKTTTAHRAAYMEAYGMLPRSVQVHHLCRNRLCVNLKHLKALTIKQHMMVTPSPARDNACKTHCKHGHEFTPDNTILYRGKRQCKACGRRLSLAAYHKRAKTLATQNHTKGALEHESYG